jgi:hypothetical protein
MLAAQPSSSLQRPNSTVQHNYKKRNILIVHVTTNTINYVINTGNEYKQGKEICNRANNQKLMCTVESTHIYNIKLTVD